MSGLDIEAIRRRRDAFRDARARVLRAWEPGSDRTDEERQRADRAQRAAAFDAALDVEALLDQVVRERAALDEALATVREQAAEIERLTTASKIAEADVVLARADVRDAGAEIRRLRTELRDARAALADALQVIADLRGGTP